MPIEDVFLSIGTNKDMALVGSCNQRCCTGGSGDSACCNCSASSDNCGGADDEGTPGGIDGACQVLLPPALVARPCPIFFTLSNSLVSAFAMDANAFAKAAICAAWPALSSSGAAAAASCLTESAGAVPSRLASSAPGAMSMCKWKCTSRAATLPFCEGPRPSELDVTGGNPKTIGGGPVVSGTICTVCIGGLTIGESITGGTAIGCAIVGTGSAIAATGTTCAGDSAGCCISCVCLPPEAGPGDSRCENGGLVEACGFSTLRSKSEATASAMEAIAVVYDAMAAALAAASARARDRRR